MQSDGYFLGHGIAPKVTGEDGMQHLLFSSRGGLFLSTMDFFDVSLP